MQNKPLVSCVMPTWNRRPFIEASIDSFLRQDYPNKELVILDDGEEPIEDLVPADARIRYSFHNRRQLTGDKRNSINEMANGEIICHWDDDDWSGPTRVTEAVNRISSSGLPVTGNNSMLYWNGREARIWKARLNRYVHGSSLCYLKSFWNILRFKSRQSETDVDWTYAALEQISANASTPTMVARLHRCHHTSRKDGIRTRCEQHLIPGEFWRNEQLINPGIYQ